MNRYQYELARHTLGLPNRNKVSYRNYYSAGPLHTDYPVWQGLVFALWAIEEKQSDNSSIFRLTLEGAKLVLEPFEKLNFDDFPELAPPPKPVLKKRGRPKKCQEEKLPM